MLECLNKKFTKIVDFLKVIYKKNSIISWIFSLYLLYLNLSSLAHVTAGKAQGTSLLPRALNHNTFFSSRDE